jgi:hypothetical protein
MTDAVAAAAVRIEWAIVGRFCLCQLHSFMYGMILPPNPFWQDRLPEISEKLHIL